MEDAPHRTMTERRNRVWRAWKDTRLKQAECVGRFGWNRNTFKRNPNGSMTFSFKRAKQYVDAFKVRAEWLYDGNGRSARSQRQGALQ
jgi:hypothetical protein